MYCNKCGAEISNNANFCKMCGAKLNILQDVNDEYVVENSNTNNINEKYSGKKVLDIIAKIIMGVLAAIAFIMIIGGTFDIFEVNVVHFIIFVGVVGIVGWLEEKLPKFPAMFFAILEIIALIFCFAISNDVSSVLSVKKGCPNQYPDITYEEAFEEYFANPTWKNIGKDEEGNEIVKFTGSCAYLGNEAIAEIKFKIYEEQGSFIVSSVKVNNEEMDVLGNVLIMTVFEEYIDNHSQANYDDNTNDYSSKADINTNVTASNDILSDENVKNIEEFDINYSDIYGMILMDTEAMYDEFCYYSIYDMNNDGTKELILSYGTCNADYTNTVYTPVYYDDGEDCYWSAEEIGTFGTMMSIYASPNGNGINGVYVHMDWAYIVNAYFDNNGKLINNVIYEGPYEEINVELGEPLMSNYVNDHGLLHNS